MRPKGKLLALLLCLGAFTPGLKAQNKVIIKDDVPNSIMFISKTKANDDIVQIMQYTRLPHFREPNAPRFLLVDQKGKFALGIGGYVQTVAEYDFGGIVNDMDFFPAMITPKGVGGPRNQFQMDITTSTLFLKLVGKTKKLGDFVVYINGNFRGENMAFQLQNAYVQFLGMLAGYNYGNFMDLAAVPTTIDFAGPSGLVFYRTTQFSYTHKLNDKFRFTVAAEMPSVDAKYNTDDDDIDTAESTAQRMPDFVANVQYNWGPSSQIRAAGIVRSMTYNSINNVGDIHAKSVIGWGAQLSSTFTICKKMQFFGQVNYGKGIGQVFNDISNLNVDIVPDPENPQKMQVLPMLGWYAGLQYNFSPSVFMSSTYSQSRLYSHNGWPTENSEYFRYGQYFVINAFWNITPNLQTGIEYLRGWRTPFKDNAKAHANRMNVMLQYSF